MSKILNLKCNFVSGAGSGVFELPNQSSLAIQEEGPKETGAKSVCFTQRGNTGLQFY